MKPLQAILVALGAAAAASALTLVADLTLVHPASGTASGTQAAAPGTPASTAAASPEAARGDDGTLAADTALARLDKVTQRLSVLETQVQDLTTSRRAAVASEDTMRDARAAAEALPDENSEARDLILSVLQDKEEADRQAREQERLQRTQDRMLQRADDVAQQLGLSRSERDTVASLLTEESTRRSALFDQMRNGTGLPPDRDTIRQEMQAISEWKTSELSSRFGSDLGAKIDDMTQDRGFGGRGRFGGGGGRGGRGGNGGGGNGGDGGGGGGNGR